MTADGSQARGESSLGFHGKLGYAWEGAVSGAVSTSFLTQDVEITGGDDGSIRGFDIFGKVSYQNFGLAAYYFTGKGMTTLALGGLIFPGFDAVGKEEESNGYYIQGTYTFNNTKVGIHWAQSEQTKITEVENSRLTFGVYHNLTPALTLLGEINFQESELDAGKDETSSFNLGAILFF